MMTSNQHGDGALALRVAPAKWIPFVVCTATASLLAWSAWPMLRPATRVEVVQVVFDRRAPALGAAVASAVSQPVQAPGWLEAEPYSVACSAMADGVIATMEVLEGDRVDAGQVVARLVADDAALRLRGAEAEHARALASVDLARAEHEAAQASWESPVELERAVEAGAAALAEARAETAQLAPLIESARAILLRFNEEQSRIERSLASGAATEFEALVVRRRVESQQAELAALEARAPVLEARVERLTAVLRSAERTLDLRIEDRRRLAGSRAALHRAEASAQLSAADRDAAALHLERMTIRAPVAGVVQRRLKGPGDKVVRAIDDPHSVHIVELYDPARLQVRVDVPLADAAQVFAGQACEVVVEALPDRVFRGEVLRITHMADIQKNTLQAKVRVQEPDPLLRPEMLTRVRFLAHDADADASAAPGLHDATQVLAPAKALEGSGDTARVWVVVDRQAERGVLRAREVVVVSRDGDWVTVRGDLSPGALLAMGDGLHEGQRVTFASASEGAS